MILSGNVVVSTLLDFAIFFFDGFLERAFLGKVLGGGGGGGIETLPSFFLFEMLLPSTAV